LSSPTHPHSFLPLDGRHRTEVPVDGAWLVWLDPWIAGLILRRKQRRRGLSALAISAALEPDLPWSVLPALTPQLGVGRLD